MVKQDYFQIFLLKCTTPRCSDGCYCPQTPNKGEREDQREPSEYTGFSDKEIYAEKYLLNTTQTTMPSGAFHSWVSSTLSQSRNLLHLIVKKKKVRLKRWNILVVIDFLFVDEASTCNDIIKTGDLIEIWRSKTQHYSKPCDIQGFSYLQNFNTAN